MFRNLIIHTSDKTLVIMKEFVFIYHLTDVNRYYLNTMETLQRSRSIKRGNEINNKCH